MGFKAKAMKNNNNLNPNNSAFPYMCTGDTYKGDSETGLTKRELFAMSAMQGLAALHIETYGLEEMAELAKHSVKLADELLKALEP